MATEEEEEDEKEVLNHQAPRARRKRAEDWGLVGQASGLTESLGGKWKVTVGSHLLVRNGPYHSCSRSLARGFALVDYTVMPPSPVQAKQRSSQRRRWRAAWMIVLPVIVGLLTWIGYEWNWIAQRRRLIDEQAAKVAAIGTVLRDVEVYDAAPQEVPTAVKLLSLFGEKPRDAVMVVFYGDSESSQLTESQKLELESARGLFPESLIMWKMVETRR